MIRAKYVCFHHFFIMFESTSINIHSCSTSIAFLVYLMIFYIDYTIYCYTTCNCIIIEVYQTPTGCLVINLSTVGLGAAVYLVSVWRVGKVQISYRVARPSLRLFVCRLPAADELATLLSCSVTHITPHLTSLPQFTVFELISEHTPPFLCW